MNNVGHAHPRVVQTLREQAGKLTHISNFYLSRPQAELSRRLTEISGLDRVFLTNSGAESVEGAIKIARKYAYKNGRGGTVLSMEGCFHGRTLATISTGKESMQTGFGPRPGGFVQVPFNDIDALHQAINDAGPQQISAIIMELIQGEGGHQPGRTRFLCKPVRKVCDENDIVLIFDEIQSGVGRTGQWFAKDHYGVQPDIMTLAKGLGGGVPIGAILSTQRVSNAMDYGDHGTTFGGNPLVSAVACTVLDVIEEEKLLEAVVEKGQWIRQRLTRMNPPGMLRIKGEGLMLGIEFDYDTKTPGRRAVATWRAGQRHGRGTYSGWCLPLNITMSELKTAFDAMEHVLLSRKTPSL